MEKFTGTLRTYENNCMSLSCDGEMTIEDSKVLNVSFKGYPRTNGDTWTNFYKRINVGDLVTVEDAIRILKFHGSHNVVSTFKGESASQVMSKLPI